MPLLFSFASMICIIALFKAFSIYAHGFGSRVDCCEPVVNLICSQSLTEPFAGYFSIISICHAYVVIYTCLAMACLINVLEVSFLLWYGIDRAIT